MATTKTLRPTNVTISIPEFTDQPDQRVNSNCIDKEADAINALSEQIGTLTIKRHDCGYIASGADGQISYPTGTNKNNIAIVGSQLSVSGTKYNVISIEYLDDSYIHIHNNGGAGGTAYFDYFIVP